MPVPEGPDSLRDLRNQLDAIYTPPEGIGEILLSVVARNNESAAGAEDTSLACPWNEEYYYEPSIRVSPFNNDLQVAIEPKATQGGTKLIRIGYFSPVTNGYLLFPELIEEDEVETVRVAAFIESAAVLDRFNERAEDTVRRLDYSAAEVRALHLGHYEYLNGGGLNLMGLMEAYNQGLPDNKKGDPPLEVDAQTQAAVYLKPNGNTQPDYFMGLRVSGLFRYMHGAKLRQPTLFLNLAQHHDDDQSPFVYVPANDTLRQYEVDELTDLAIGVIATRLQMDLQSHQFDAQYLALTVPPSTKSKS